jgi:hypothetical protein
MAPAEKSVTRTVILKKKGEGGEVNGEKWTGVVGSVKGFEDVNGQSWVGLRCDWEERGDRLIGFCQGTQVENEDLFLWSFGMFPLRIVLLASVDDIVDFESLNKREESLKSSVFDNVEKQLGTLFEEKTNDCKFFSIVYQLQRSFVAIFMRLLLHCKCYWPTKEY